MGAISTERFMIWLIFERLCRKAARNFRPLPHLVDGAAEKFSPPPLRARISVIRENPADLPN
jgi:hypothetical protein